jgi:hypothetical protein
VVVEPLLPRWNDAAMKKIGLSCWYATERRTENERPSRMFSTRYSMGSVGSPGRTKYPCSECTKRVGSTVRPAATSA